MQKKRQIAVASPIRTDPTVIDAQDDSARSLTRKEGRSDRNKSRFGRTLVDLALLAGCLYMGWLLTSSALDAAHTKAELGIVETEALELFEAFELYHKRNHAYPSTYSQARFDPATLDPLRKRGYYRGPITGSLFNRRADAYDSPDDRGPNREFWLELSLRSDPSIRLLLASSDDAPLGGGQWREGVFIFRDGKLEKL